MKERQRGGRMPTDKDVAVPRNLTSAILAMTRVPHATAEREERIGRDGKEEIVIASKE